MIIMRRKKEKEKRKRPSFDPLPSFPPFLPQQKKTVEKLLWPASRDGNDDKVRKLLRETPHIYVNWKQHSWAPLHAACHYQNDKIVSLLLAHPGVDVNLKNTLGQLGVLVARLWTLKTSGENMS